MAGLWLLCDGFDFIEISQEKVQLWSNNDAIETIMIPLWADWGDRVKRQLSVNSVDFSSDFDLDYSIIVQSMCNLCKGLKRTGKPVYLLGTDIDSKMSK